MKVRSLKLGDILKNRKGEEVRVGDVCNTTTIVTCGLTYRDSGENCTVALFTKNKDGLIDIDPYTLLSENT